ncbi:MAG TPA: SDR family oxidoreductase [Syntrophales bacterium]|nr:SDR family oxidoreductase [Syntrophales bacterium]HPQ44713.1 SDR family oxidoreductase [Syntrophales bacterium]
MKVTDYYRNKIILIIGAGSGIGKALGEEIANLSPAKLILADINEESLQTAKDGMRYADIETYQVDVSSEESMNALFESCIGRHDRIDIVFNNAGIAAGGEFQDYTFADWEKIIRVNLWGIIYGSTLAYKHMIRQKQGHIVNTASLGGLIPEPMASVYVTTKYAVVGLTTTLREEARAYGVNVSVVCPGVVKTPIYDTADFVGNIDGNKVKNATLEHGAITAHECAKRMVRGVARNKGIILVKAVDRLFWGVYRIRPSALSPINQWLAKHFREHFQKE